MQLQLPDEIISKIMTYHSNIQFDKNELSDYVKVRKKYYKCTRCVIKGNMSKLYNILDSDERVGVLFFKWVVNRMNPDWEWDDLHHEHYYNRIPGSEPCMNMLWYTLYY